MDEFTQIQLREYEDISRAQFKTNEVLATFFRYFLLIAAIQITAVGTELINISAGGIGGEARFLGYIIFGVSTLLLSIIAVIAYIKDFGLMQFYNQDVHAKYLQSQSEISYKRPR